NHQEGTGFIEAIHLRSHRFRGRLAEHDLIHRAEYDPSFVHVRPPGTFFFGRRVANDFPIVMREDRRVRARFSRFRFGPDRGRAVCERAGSYSRKPASKSAHAVTTGIQSGTGATTERVDRRIELKAEILPSATVCQNVCTS